MKCPFLASGQGDLEVKFYFFLGESRKYLQGWLFKKQNLSEATQRFSVSEVVTGRQSAGGVDKDVW